MDMIGVKITVKAEEGTYPFHFLYHRRIIRYFPYKERVKVFKEGHFNEKPPQFRRKGRHDLSFDQPGGAGSEEQGDMGCTGGDIPERKTGQVYRERPAFGVVVDDGRQPGIGADIQEPETGNHFILAEPEFVLGDSGQYVFGFQLCHVEA